MDLIRVPVTNPGAINNSGSIQFTAQIATVAKINFNRIVNDEEYNAYVNASWYLLNARKHHHSSCDKKHKKDKKDKKNKKDKKSKHRKH